MFHPLASPTSVSLSILHSSHTGLQALLKHARSSPCLAALHMLFPLPEHFSSSDPQVSLAPTPFSSQRKYHLFRETISLVEIAPAPSPCVPSSCFIFLPCTVSSFDSHLCVQECRLYEGRLCSVHSKHVSRVTQHTGRLHARGLCRPGQPSGGVWGGGSGSKFSAFSLADSKAPAEHICRSANLLRPPPGPQLRLWSQGQCLSLGPSPSARELAGSGKPGPGLAGARKGLSAEGQGPANLTPPNSDRLSQQLPSPLKTSQQPPSHRDSRCQRGRQPGCFRPPQGMVVPASQEALGLPGPLGTHSLGLGREQARTDPGPPVLSALVCRCRPGT